MPYSDAGPEKPENRGCMKMPSQNIEMKNVPQKTSVAVGQNIRSDSAPLIYQHEYTLAEHSHLLLR